jgi:hypothetical protein
MIHLKFVWDEHKNRANKKKHGISFEEAQSVFFDENAIEFYDPDSSVDEERFILLGISQNLHILVVCHCYRKNESEIRIINARQATKKEQKVYTGGKKI